MDLSLLTKEECDLLLSEIEAAGRIVICVHQGPDGDAVGSSLGFAQFLMTFGKNPQVIFPDQYPDFLKWLPGISGTMRYDKNPESAEKIIEEAQLIFLLDLNDPSRTGAMEEIIRKSKAKKIVIDHHLNPMIDDACLIVSHPQMCSTCEIVFRIISQLGKLDSLGPDFAVPIYCGMMTDTGGFVYNSSRPEIYYIISLLLTKGIDKDKIYRNVYNNYSYNRLRLTGFVMSRKLRYFPYLNASYFTITREDMKRFHFIKGDAEGLVNMPLQIKGLKLSISLREDTEKDNWIHVSLRSVDDFPCNEMAARFFNGGGHLNASGGRLHSSIDEATETVRRALEAYKSKLN